jgi:twitching motility two-component system response regulator PilH
MATILIVDDSVTMMEGHKRILEKQGHTVHHAENGEEGVARSLELLPDLILMDVVMPKMNGFQATRKITKDDRTKHIPVVIVTSKDQETDIMWGKRQGASDYLIKPADEDRLKVTVERLLSEAAAEA